MREGWHKKKMIKSNDKMTQERTQPEPYNEYDLINKTWGSFLKIEEQYLILNCVVWQLKAGDYFGHYFDIIVRILVLYNHLRV